MACIHATKFCSQIKKFLFNDKLDLNVRNLSSTPSIQGPFRCIAKYFKTETMPTIRRTPNHSISTAQEKRRDKFYFASLVIAPLHFCSRHFASAAASKRKAAETKNNVKEDPCDAKKKESWKLFSAKGTEERQKVLKKCREACIEHRDFQKGPDPDLDHIGGRVFKTCGTSYIVQKDIMPKKKIPDSVLWEENIIEKLERHPELKDFKDPLPAFKSVEQRLLDLSEKKLHPLYRKYMLTPREPRKVPVPKYFYKSRSGPIKPEEIPVKFKFNKQLLDKKNIYADFKIVEPPKQLLAKFLEIKLNERPTMERKNQNKN